ncbi:MULTISPECIES: hypothetical protein [Lactococcus]|nr:MULTISPECIES: hypothetical protein [Lactococcus]MBL3715692.1 hypothetical protein [Lactococcus garvieae]
MKKKKRRLSIRLMSITLLALGGLGVGQAKTFEEDLKVKIAEYIEK